VIASGMVGVIFFSEIRYLHTYLTPILAQFLNTSPITIESMRFHQDSASADTANNNMICICLHYLLGAEFFISLHFLSLFHATHSKHFISGNS
jgi:hypothetical protein